jgi:SH3 domain protein
MKKLILMTTLFFLISPIIHAETMYIVNLKDIMQRTGPGLDHKIIAILPPGSAVEVIEMNEAWANVNVPDGKEGWVLRRFLKPDRIDPDLFIQFNKEYKSVQTRAETLEQENQTLITQAQDIRNKLNQIEAEKDKIQKELDTLKNESTEFLDIKTKNEAISQKLVQQTQKAAQLENDLIELKRDKRIWWILSGMVVFLIGFLISYNAKRQKRQSLL